MTDKLTCENKDREIQKSALDFVEGLIKKQLSWYAPGYDIYGSSPRTDPNHDYWKEILEIQLAEFRRLNSASITFQGRPVTQDLMDSFESLGAQARSGKITFREAYTSILLADYNRVLRLKYRSTQKCTIEELNSLKQRTK